MSTEDALKYLVSILRSDQRWRIENYGYGIYIPQAINVYVSDVLNLKDPEAYPKKVEMSPSFYAAAWDLCRRGILRPGIRQMHQQATDDGSAGNGYSITPFGETWIKESDRDNFVPTEPERFAKLLELYRDRLGSLFYERAQEAVRCYGAHAYLACCAMCGAAAESILLAIAINHMPEEEVLKAYTRAQGTQAVEKIALTNAPDWLKREFQGYTGLLKYWRNASAHGAVSGITDDEAFTSLAYLLRFAMSVNRNLETLTKTSSGDQPLQD